MSTIAIVTVLYEAEDCLSDFIISLKKQSKQDYVIIGVDNSSSNIPGEIFNQLCLDNDIECIYLKQEKNLGVAAANNIGIKKAKELEIDCILLSNYDISIDDNLLIEKMYNEYKNGECVITCPSLYYNSDKYWYAGGKFDFIRGTTPHFGNRLSVIEYKIKEEYTIYTPTTFVMINYKVFEKYGFFDESYFVYFDDSDFFIRLKEEKIRLIDSYYYHKVSQTVGAESEFLTYYMNRNRIKFIDKNFNFKYKLISNLYCYLTAIYRLIFKEKHPKQLLMALKDAKLKK
ncbi:glycosyltransferase family 2 protein [Photobacterium leiognathi]|uniref:glycosyltransferase family 2 protein n=1 Tax=Photobacterium leiognathi TaxID=553611 RepID=UPI002980A75B|nr:glycosyltransferase family 2 protein [Photobacterium leiognathi]